MRESAQSDRQWLLFRDYARFTALPYAKISSNLRQSACKQNFVYSFVGSLIVDAVDIKLGHRYDYPRNLSHASIRSNIRR